MVRAAPARPATDVQISVKADIAAAKRQVAYWQREAIPKAAAHALNRTAQQVQSAAVKEIARETGLKQKDVREAMSRARATWGRLVAAVIATGRAVNLIRFTRQTRAGARKAGGVSANAWGRRRLYRGTFIANQGRTVFVRESDARLPIKPVHGPSVPREMVREKVSRLLRTVIDTNWPKNFRDDLRYYLNRR